jgi:hypothetical protein
MFEDKDPPVYCPNCGSIVDAGAAFCDVCGARIPPNASAARPTQEIPPVVPPPQVPPQQQPGTHRNRNLMLAFGIGAVLLVLLAVGGVFFFNLSGSDSASGGRGSGPAGGSEERGGGASNGSNDAGQSEQDSQAGESDSEPQPSTPEPETSTPEPAGPESGQSSAPSETEAIDAAENYYQYAESGDYYTTYDLLSSEYQTYYTQDEWVAANTTLDSAAAEFVVTDAYPDDLGLGVPTYAVMLTVSLPDGSSFERTTYFIYENDQWAHHLSQEEVDTFDGAL